VVEAVDPWRAFQHLERTPQVLARAVIEGLDLPNSLEKCKGFSYHTPVADWMYRILRPVFADQFFDDDAYETAFHTAEVMLGAVSQYHVTVRTEGVPERAWLRDYSNWYGRSTHRSNHHDIRPVEDLLEEQTAQGATWGPIRAGLFGGDVDYAHEVIGRYREGFEEARRQQRWRS
jgi:hypothetical protein